MTVGAILTGEAVGIAVSAASPIQNINELVEMMKADPASVSWEVRPAARQ